jgi:hypothetical protein
MKDFFSRNGVSILANLITVVVLLISLAVAWGQINSQVEFNKITIAENHDNIKVFQVEARSNDVQFAEIQKDLAYIKVLLIEMRGK